MQQYTYRSHISSITSGSYLPKQKGTSKNTFHAMRQVSTQPTKWALAFANAGVSREKVQFLEMPKNISIF